VTPISSPVTVGETIKSFKNRCYTSIGYKIKRLWELPEVKILALEHSANGSERLSYALVLLRTTPTLYNPSH
jgi:hypothetical protein